MVVLDVRKLLGSGVWEMKAFTIIALLLPDHKMGSRGGRGVSLISG